MMQQMEEDENRIVGTDTTNCAREKDSCGLYHCRDSLAYKPEPVRTDKDGQGFARRYGSAVGQWDGAIYRRQ